MKRDRSISIQVSAGELIDKLTILEIRAERIGNARKLRHVQQELMLLRTIRASAIRSTAQLTKLTQRLTTVNKQLWRIEDAIRVCEQKQEFGPQFIELARSVYHLNDWRSELKRRINELVGSTLVEEKSYSRYKRSSKIRGGDPVIRAAISRKP